MTLKKILVSTLVLSSIAGTALAANNTSEMKFSITSGVTDNVVITHNGQKATLTNPDMYILNVQDLKANPNFTITFNPNTPKDKATFECNAMTNSNYFDNPENAVYFNVSTDGAKMSQTTDYTSPTHSETPFIIASTNPAHPGPVPAVGEHCHRIK